MKRNPKKPRQPQPSETPDTTPVGGDVVQGDKISAGHDYAGRDIIHGDQVGRDKITNVTLGRNVIQIGTLVMPTVPVVVGALLLTAGLIFIGLSVAGTFAAPGPKMMQGSFNVAVAQFGQQDERGQILASEDGRRLSKIVFDALKEQIRDFEDATIRSAVQIWHDDLPLSEMGTDIGLVADETAAAQLADRIQADMVIYGTLDRQNGFTPKFYVSPQVKGEIDSAVTGRHELGSEPIHLDPSARLAVSTDLATRTGALFYLSMGLTYDVFGRAEEALAVYRRAEAQLTGWREKKEGKEVLYFFLGQAALFASQRANAQDAPGLEQEAQQAFQNALNSNAEYARARVGLGSVYFLQAQRTQPKSSLIEATDVLTKTFDEYTQALTLAQRTSDKQAELLAIFSLGSAYYLKGGAYWIGKQYAPADLSFQAAIDTLQTILSPLAETKQQRLLGQAYLALGAAYKQQAQLWAEQGDKPKSLSLYDQARRAYESCIAQGDGSQDEILLTLVVEDKCVPQLDAVNRALDAGGGDK